MNQVPTGSNLLRFGVYYETPLDLGIRVGVRDRIAPKSDMPGFNSLVWYNRWPEATPAIGHVDGKHFVISNNTSFRSIVQASQCGVGLGQPTSTVAPAKSARSFRLTTQTFRGKRYIIFSTLLCKASRLGYDRYAFLYTEVL